MTSTKSNVYLLISSFYGFKLRDGLEKLDLGDFTICNKIYIEKNYPETNDIFKAKYIQSTGLIAEIDFYYVIQRNIKADDLQNAITIFENSIDHLINTILYCIPVRQDKNRRISTRDERANQILFIKTNDSSHESYSNHDLSFPLYVLDENIFTFPGNSSRLFEYITTDPSTNIQSRICRAANWIGQALRNPDIIEGFLWLAVALETLLIAQDGFISKSITAQIAEFAAFLTEGQIEKRKEINKRVKDLYKKRSAIVHSFSVDIKEDDFADLLRILKGIIYTYFNLIDRKNISKIDDIVSYIDDLKFS